MFNVSNLNLSFVPMAHGEYDYKGSHYGRTNQGHKGIFTFIYNKENESLGSLQEKT